MPKRSSTKSTLVRLNKYLADSGLSSRRKCDGLILSGSVQVNGKTVTELGVRVDPLHDRVMVDGKPVKPPSLKIYLVFYKPENVLTSMSDPEGRPTVGDFMEQMPVRVFPVGRLDWDTEGMLLLTNDGDFAQKVMHPKHEIPKTYLAKLDGQPTDEQLDKLLRGVTIPGGRVAAIHVERAKLGHSDQYDWIKIIIGEGKNRQVRHMFNKIGYDVKKLKRVAIGQLTLGPLQKGEYAFIDDGAIRKIFAVYKEREKEPVRIGAKRRLASGGSATAASEGRGAAAGRGSSAKAGYAPKRGFGPKSESPGKRGFGAKRGPAAKRGFGGTSRGPAADRSRSSGTSPFGESSARDSRGNRPQNKSRSRSFSGGGSRGGGRSS